MSSIKIHPVTSVTEVATLPPVTLADVLAAALAAVGAEDAAKGAVLADAAAFELLARTMYRATLAGLTDSAILATVSHLRGLTTLTSVGAHIRTGQVLSMAGDPWPEGFNARTSILALFSCKDKVGGVPRGTSVKSGEFDRIMVDASTKQAAYRGMVAQRRANHAKLLAANVASVEAAAKEAAAAAGPVLSESKMDAGLPAVDPDADVLPCATVPAVPVGADNAATIRACGVAIANMVGPFTLEDLAGLADIVATINAIADVTVPLLNAALAAK